MKKPETTDQDQRPDAASSSDVDPSTSAKIGVNTADAAPASAVATKDQEGGADRIVVSNQNFPSSLGDGIELFQGNDGHAYLRRAIQPSLPVLRVGTKSSDAFLRRLAHEHEKYPRAGDVRDINDNLSAHAEFSGEVREVWYRIAPIHGGIEIDLGDRDRTRVQVMAGRVSILSGGSETLFRQTSTMRALPVPAEVGDVGRLRRHLNLPEAEKCLAIGWLSYVLGHPKSPTNGFPILAVYGEQGSGKSVFCRIVQALTDPSDVCLQTFPRSGRDLAIAAQQAHVLFYENMREIHTSMSDNLCIAASGGTFATRMLYSNADQVALRLHVALVLNGLHAFVQEPDLAQRCLPLTMRPIDEGARRNEAALDVEFQADLPFIFRGLLDHIASVFTHLPAVQVTSPERMIDFSRWLAAMERVDGIPGDPYQTQYSEVLKSGMLDSLLEDPLAAAVLALVDGEPGSRWSGTPAELLRTLDASVTSRTHYSRDWPVNEIALSIRLKSLKVAFRRQGVDVRLSRSKKRLITITRVEVASHD